MDKSYCVKVGNMIIVISVTVWNLIKIYLLFKCKMNKSFLKLIILNVSASFYSFY